MYGRCRISVIMRKKKENSVSFGTILILIMILAGMTVSSCMFVYPGLADTFSQLHTADMVRGYIDGISSQPGERIERERKKASEYNRALTEEREISPFHYMGAEASDSIYESCLSFDDSMEMCYIDIPDIDVYLPVTHGTRSGPMRYECGHMYGTSLPVGGNSTHAVIAGHTGLRNAKIFTDLVRMKKGQEFYIHILGEIHVYKIDSIKTVLPEEADDELQIRKGQDLVTLYTCTPYGINDHRLLVRGVRAYPNLMDDIGSGAVLINERRNRSLIMKAVFYLMVPAVVFVTGLILTKKSLKKGETDENN